MTPRVRGSDVEVDPSDYERPRGSVRGRLDLGGLARAEVLLDRQPCLEWPHAEWRGVVALELASHVRTYTTRAQTAKECFADVCSWAAKQLDEVFR